MSNTQVGMVYQQIIADVVESSRVDFEEGGVEDSILEELRKGWQQKLSQLQVAAFPWDPKPEPIINPPTVPSNTNGSYRPLGPPPVMPGASTPENSNEMNGGGPHIKTEPGMGSPSMMANNLMPHQMAQYNAPLNLPLNATTAQQRAAQHLHQNYGSRAAASINAIQTGHPGQNQQHPQNGGQTMQQMQQMHHAQMMQHQQQQQQQQRAQGMNQMQQGQNQQQSRPQPQYTQEAYQRMLASGQAQQQRLQQQNAQRNNSNGNGVGNAQTDGAGDEEETYSLVKQIGADGQETTLGRIDIDGLIREKIEAQGRRMEGGGLMLPLSQASTSASRRHNKVKKTNRGQFDGPDDDDEDVKEDLDEDAINSDLDDPDDGNNEEDDEDEGMGQIMLCMYDKVQRVKNKWKCVMKDGVLTVNGREYVFHKASGEYEW